MSYHHWLRFYAFLILFSPCGFTQSGEYGFYLEVEYIRQIKNYCGPASLEMVFHYWNQSVNQHELASNFAPFPKKGLSGAQLKELAAKYGFDAYSFSGDTDLLLEHLRKGRPLIVALESSSLLNRNHFVVLVGWDESHREWLIHDPGKGPYQRFSVKKFAKQWGQLDNWTLLVVAGNKR